MACDPWVEASVVCGADDGEITSVEGWFGHGFRDLSLEIPDTTGLATRSLDDLPDVPATLIWRNQRFEVGVQLKGGRSFRGFEDKPSLKIDFGEFVDGQTMLGLRRLTLNNAVQDPARISEHVSYGFYAAVGIAAPRHAYACLTVNGQPFGLYSMPETLDEVWVADQFTEEGGFLLEGGGLSDFTIERAAEFEVEEGDDSFAIETVAETVAGLEAVVSGGLLPFLSARFAPNTLDFFAASLILGDADGYVANANNFLVYYSPSTNQFQFVPWGQDSNLRRAIPIFSPSAGAGGELGTLYARCIDEPACKAAFGQAAEGAVARWESSDVSGSTEKIRDEVAPLAMADPLAPFTAEDVQKAGDEYLQFVEARPDSVRENLAGE